MIDFLIWCESHSPELLEFISAGHSEGWGDPKASSERLNDERYAARGVRSKYVANMKSGNKKKTSTRKSIKRTK